MKEQKKLSLLVSIQIMAIAVFLNGCLIRTYTVTKDRPDQEVSGNQGFLSGQAPANYQQPKKFTQRRYKFFEVELQSPLKIEHLKEPPKPSASPRGEPPDIPGPKSKGRRT